MLDTEQLAKDLQAVLDKYEVGLIAVPIYAKDANGVWGTSAEIKVVPITPAPKEAVIQADEPVATN